MGLRTLIPADFRPSSTYLSGPCESLTDIGSAVGFAYRSGTVVSRYLPPRDGSRNTSGGRRTIGTYTHQGVAFDTRLDCGRRYLSSTITTAAASVSRSHAVTPSRRGRLEAGGAASRGEPDRVLWSLYVRCRVHWSLVDARRWSVERHLGSGKRAIHPHIFRGVSGFQIYMRPALGVVTLQSTPLLNIDRRVSRDCRTGTLDSKLRDRQIPVPIEQLRNRPVVSAAAYTARTNPHCGRQANRTPGKASATQGVHHYVAHHLGCENRNARRSPEHFRYG